MRYHDIASASLPIAVLLVAVVIIAIYSAMRFGKQRERGRRRAAWRAKRDEEDRIWEERFGAK